MLISRLRRGLSLGVNRVPSVALPLVLVLVLVLVALFMPTAWYDTLPRTPELPARPISGTTLLRVILGLQAVVIGVLARRGWRWTPLPPALRVSGFALRREPHDLEAASARRWLLLITLVALVLRVYGIGADLWTDELMTIDQTLPMSFAEIVGSYQSSNNHLLMSLIIKASVMAFGLHEWSVRLGVAAFGVASIPALYRVARLAMSRRSSLGAALLLAVSYHHVFFSQNARGYVAYVFFALLATRALIDALRDDRLSDWVQYGVATVFGMMALLNAAFVIAAQLLVVAVIARQQWKRAGVLAPLLWRLVSVYTVTGLCSLGLYAVALPDAYLYITSAYTLGQTGSSATSNDLVKVVARGVVEGFGPGLALAAVPFLGLATAGFVVLWRRQWAITALLSLPGVLTALLLVSRGMTFSPRFFLLWLPLAVLTAVVTVDATAARLPFALPARRQAVSLTLIGVLATLSALSLVRYYAVPKQPYSATLQYLERGRGDDDLVLAIRPTWLGVHYYGTKLQLSVDRNYVEIGEVATFDSAMTAHGTRRVRLITTL
ncbi:glycosyltransferase family 39 protein, partial [Gemmatimonas sp.]|uniref:glycosyltransferase family 39 protein n=1 Tax=Gemmatimonas sp. TaxID=1962908 RepID=UPI003982E1FC